MSASKATSTDEEVDDAARLAPTAPEALASLAPTAKAQSNASLIESLLASANGAYKWWERAYRTGMETAVSFIGLTIVVTPLILQALPLGDLFSDVQFVALVGAGTVITLAAVTGRAVKGKAAAQAQGKTDAILQAASQRLRQDSPNRVGITSSEG